MKFSFKGAWEVTKQVIDEYSDNKTPKLGAALAYYTVFSLAPLLVIAIAVAGLVFGPDAAAGRINEEMRGLVGQQGAELMQTAIQKSYNSSAGILATILGVVTLGIGATAVFIELQDSLDIIWKVKSVPSNAIWGFVKTRLVSFALVVAMGFLLLVSLLISAALTALNQFMTKLGFIPVFVLQIINIVISLGVIFALFALIYKVLPDVELTWKEVRFGALVTAVLFQVGKYLIGLYLGSSSISSTYGAAGSLAVLLVWIYYSSQILFLGAILTYVYAVRAGAGIQPSAHAVKLQTETKEIKPEDVQKDDEKHNIRSKAS
ncbi:MAG: YihY/virulence factor BrkB family protein [Ignavibacteria bacterium]|jgi:membrane protein|nr:YihY/virulence factor BrkB family protein [Ignavibacteria bacterium]MCU7498749.1 YihY/virulence factor BrkB family protein [Ignavibacteria bacterium]MCU7512057.1 YihY/virulence factor BrkB family protein [Ignavibacteria bacterium]MCU7520590.1 YihY/virulence factor BrkB family protein [Ignavibacteria bacterium]MCU7523488.1 YihY/virulence factor BrkB family protein [Ignavibacteria bacterium]